MLSGYSLRNGEFFVALLRLKKITSGKLSACVALHNFLLKESPASRSMYCPPGTTDGEDWQGNLTDGSWRSDGAVNGALAALPGTGGNSARLAHAIRDKLCRHFITEDKLPWQVKHVKHCRW
ncbi:hypothetical protein MTO96_039296 [Rhipicephalus appendiculatus]